MTRQGNNPKRRIAADAATSEQQRTALAKEAVYVGSAMHKRTPGDYGFQPPTNPRPHKSLCDGKRKLVLAEAKILLRAGIWKGMISTYIEDGKPKYIWSVDNEGEPYEAKIGLGGYHGYRLEDDDEMRAVVLKEWATRT